MRLSNWEGGTVSAPTLAATLRSISDVSKHQRLKDNNAEFVEPLDMLSELRADNLNLTRSMRATHEVCEKYNDVATTSLIEIWIDQTERRLIATLEAGEPMILFAGGKPNHLASSATSSPIAW